MFLGFLRHIREFMSDYKEWHATLVGFAEGFIPWQPWFDISDELGKQVQGDYHYYVSAMVTGLIARIFTITGAIVWGLMKVIPLI